MIDLQEKMENENKKKAKNKKNTNNNDDTESIEDHIFNTSVFDSILNRTNREEMEMIFDIKYEDIKKNENIFVDNINKLLNVINSCEIKEEEEQIINNYEQKNEKYKKNDKNKNKEGVSPLMNININYINFNKFNEEKANSISINNKPKKKAILFDKIFNAQKNLNKQNKNKLGSKERKDSTKNIHSSMEKKDISLLVMKINQIQKYKLLHDKSSYMKNTKYISNQNKKNIHSHKTYTTKIRKNNSMIYDNKVKLLINNLKTNKNNEKMKNILSYKAFFSKVDNHMENQKLSIKSPLSSRNKKVDNGLKFNSNFNFSLTSRNQKNKYSNIDKSQTRNNFYKINNNSRNKNVSNDNFQFYTNNLSSKNYTIIQNSLSPSGNNFNLRQKKKTKHNYSYFNNNIFNKKFGNFNYNKNNNKTVLKENIISNNMRNNSLNLNKNISYSLHLNKANHSSSNKKIKKIDLKNIIPQKKNSLYINSFLKVFNIRTKIMNK